MRSTVSRLQTGVCILGSGPAGLGAAHELTRHGRGDVVVIDRQPFVGGLARTELFDGHRFDVGPHRFFTANEEIKNLWRETLGEDFRPVKRLTRIYYHGRFFQYPVNAFDALPKLGPFKALQALASFAHARLVKNAAQAETFEEWVSAKFGTRLYEAFFKTYTEKVWGVPGHQIGADWAAQRIKGLDLMKLVANALQLDRRDRPKTLVDEFDYPRLGAGMMYQRLAERASTRGARLLLGTRVERIETRANRVTAVEACGPDGPVRVEAEEFISTLPITRFLAMLDPLPDSGVMEACAELQYRDHITVNLLVRGERLFPAQWIYVHAPDIRMARVANYANFSDEMAGKPGLTPVGVEYFAFRADAVWNLSDADLVQLAVEELSRMGLVPTGAVERGWVVREVDSYPVYRRGFERPFAQVRQALGRFTNLQAAGRGGVFRYNNMDHAIYTGLLTARNLILSPSPGYDPWRVNIDARYLEEANR